MHNKVVRAFIAVPLLRSDTYEAMENLSNMVTNNLQRGVNLHPELYKHITLRFIGDVPVNSVETILNDLKPVLDPYKRFSVLVDHIGCFPDFKIPRFIWAGIAGDGVTGLNNLQTAIDNVVLNAGYSASDFDYHPHITLFKTDPLTSSEDLNHVGEVIKNMTEDNAFEIPVYELQINAVAFMISYRTASGGVIYETLKEYYL